MGALWGTLALAITGRLLIGGVIFCVVFGLVFLVLAAVSTSGNLSANSDER